MKKLFLFFVVAAYGCGDCDPNIELGELLLLPETQSFMIHKPNDTLIYVDQDSTEHVYILDSINDSGESQLFVNTLCEDFWDAQLEYYIVHHEEWVFKDTIGTNVISFGINTDDEWNVDPDSIAIFDLFQISARINDIKTLDFKLVTGVHQNQVSEDYSTNTIMEAVFVGDTILSNIVYKDVYDRTNENGASILYNKIDGLILMKEDENNFLKREK